MPAIIGKFRVCPAVSGQSDKIWITCESGEGGDFSRDGFYAAFKEGLARDQVNESLHRFFWDNF